MYANSNSIAIKCMLRFEPRRNNTHTNFTEINHKYTLHGNSYIKLDKEKYKHKAWTEDRDIDVEFETIKSSMNAACIGPRQGRGS